MDEPNSYCQFVIKLKKANVHRIYHDHYYGFTIDSDNELFGRLILEINQAGLSWEIILNKQDHFREAFSNFNIHKIAKYKDQDIKRLLNNSKIIRNKLKINSVIFNAQQILNIQKKVGSFKNWLDQNHSINLLEWTKLFKKTFKFTGGEITKEFLISTGYLLGAHTKDCPIFNKVMSKK